MESLGFQNDKSFFVSKVYSMMTCVYMHVDSVRDEILDDLDPGQSVIECFIFSVCEVHAPELTWREKKKVTSIPGSIQFSFFHNHFKCYLWVICVPWTVQGSLTLWVSLSGSLDLFWHWRTAVPRKGWLNLKSNWISEKMHASAKSHIQYISRICICPLTGLSKQLIVEASWKIGVCVENLLKELQVQFSYFLNCIWGGLYKLPMKWQK